MTQSMAAEIVLGRCQPKTVCCHLNWCSPKGNVLFLFGCFQVFVFFFLSLCFQEFNYNVSSQYFFGFILFGVCFINSLVYISHQTCEAFSHYFFKYFSDSTLLLLNFQNLLFLFHVSLRLFIVGRLFNLIFQQAKLYLGLAHRSWTTLVGSSSNDNLIF